MSNLKLKNKYTITFFPKHNAFIISPAPPLPDDVTKSYRDMANKGISYTEYEAFPTDERPSDGDFYQSYTNHDAVKAASNFRWVFQDEDEIEVFCNGENVTHQKVSFKQANDKSATRKHPVDENSLKNCAKDNIDENSLIKNTNESSFSFKINQAREGARWGFDFSCKIGKKEYVVDPEIQIGAAGTAG